MYVVMIVVCGGGDCGNGCGGRGACQYTRTTFRGEQELLFAFLLAWYPYPLLRNDDLSAGMQLFHGVNVDDDDDNGFGFNVGRWGGCCSHRRLVL